MNNCCDYNYNPCCSLKNILEALRGQTCIIVLNSGRAECVRVLNVCDDILICEIRGCGCPVKFVKIACICEVITDCRKVLGAFLNRL